MSEKGQKTRSEILLAATEVFADRGFYGASMANIASRASVAKSHLYLYFPSKYELYSTVLSFFLLDLRDTFLSRINSCTVNNPHVKLREIIYSYFGYLATHDFFVDISRWELANGCPFLIEGYKKHKPSCFDIIKDIVEDGIRNDLFYPIPDPIVTLLTINNVCLVPFVKLRTQANSIHDTYRMNLTTDENINLQKHITELCFTLITK